MKKIETQAAPKAIGPYSQGIMAGGWLFVSGQLGVDPKSGKLIEGTEAQTIQVFNNIEAILREAGLGLQNVVRMEVFMTNLEEFQQMNTVYAERFEGLMQPARFTVQVTRLPAGASVEIACIAYQG